MPHSRAFVLLVLVLTLLSTCAWALEVEAKAEDVFDTLTKHISANRGSTSVLAKLHSMLDSIGDSLNTDHVMTDSHYASLKDAINNEIKNLEDAKKTTDEEKENVEMHLVHNRERIAELQLHLSTMNGKRDQMLASLASLDMKLDEGERRRAAEGKRFDVRRRETIRTQTSLDAIFDRLGPRVVPKEDDSLLTKIEMGFGSEAFSQESNPNPALQDQLNPLRDIVAELQELHHVYLRDLELTEAQAVDSWKTRKEILQTTRTSEQQKLDELLATRDPGQAEIDKLQLENNDLLFNVTVKLEHTLEDIETRLQQRRLNLADVERNHLMHETQREGQLSIVSKLLQSLSEHRGSGMLYTGATQPTTDETEQNAGVDTSQL